MGSLVNTFLDNFNCTTVRVTVEGKPFSTGHSEYDKPLQAFNVLRKAEKKPVGAMPTGFFCASGGFLKHVVVLHEVLHTGVYRRHDDDDPSTRC